MDRPSGGRTPLPTDTVGLPPLPAAFHRALQAGLSELGESLSPGALAAVEGHARLLLAWNESINLTALREPEQIALEHIVDSLAALPVLRSLLSSTGHPEDPSMLDLGSGAGYPGLPLAVALPVRRVALVDSIAKKAAFLEAAARQATRAVADAGERPPDVRVRAERSESLAHDPAERERWDLVVARAVSALPELVELGLPLVRPGGHLVAWKRDDGRGSLQREVERAAHAIRQVGGSDDPVCVDEVVVERLRDHRLVVVAKVRPTPPRYPRSPTERRRLLLT